MLTLNIYQGVSMSIFDYHDYKKYVNDWIKSQPSGGHGQLRMMSIELNVNSVIMSQVFRGSRNLSAEQAVGIAKFIGLNSSDRDYFILLVQKERSGTVELKEIFEKQLADFRSASQILKTRIKHQKFSDENKATFYSHWYYSAIRLGISIPEHNTLASIGEYLGLERSLVNQVIEFLIKNQLIIENGNKFEIGPQVTHVGHDSPFVNRHHSNWRIKALQAMDKTKKDDLFYTGPMALSKSASNKIKKLVIELIEKSTKEAAESESEVLRCLTIDWFDVTK